MKPHYLENMFEKEVTDIFGCLLSYQEDYIKNIITFRPMSNEVTMEQLDKLSQLLSTKMINFHSTIENGYYGESSLSSLIECSDVLFNKQI